jgi:hypothetical protein
MTPMRSRKHQNVNLATGCSDEVQFIGYMHPVLLSCEIYRRLWVVVVGFINEFDNLECRATVRGIEMYQQIIKFLVLMPTIWVDVFIRFSSSNSGF